MSTNIASWWCYDTVFVIDKWFLSVILTNFMFSVSSSCIQQKPQFVNGAEKLVSYPYHMTLKTCMGHVQVWAIGPWAKSPPFQCCYFDMHFQYWCQNISTENSMVWHLMEIINDKLTSLQVPSYYLTHRGWATHICISNLTIIGSDNGLSPGQCQAIFWTNAGILLIWPLGTNFGEMIIEIHAFSFKKMYLTMSSVKRWPFCPSLNQLNQCIFNWNASLPETVLTKIYHTIWCHWQQWIKIWIKCIQVEYKHTMGQPIHFLVENSAFLFCGR